MFHLKHTAVWTLQKQSSEGVLKKSVLKNLEDFTGKHLCWSLILVKLCATASVQYSFLVYKEQNTKKKNSNMIFFN